MTMYASALDEKERGAGSVQVLGYAAVFAALFFMLVIAGAMLQAKHRAHAGADLGSIAGARAVNEGYSVREACSYAQRIVLENKAEITQCIVNGDTVTVMAESQPALSALPRVYAKGVAAPDQQQKM